MNQLKKFNTSLFLNPLKIYVYLNPLENYYAYYQKLGNWHKKFTSQKKISLIIEGFVSDLK